MSKKANPCSQQKVNDCVKEGKYCNLESGRCVQADTVTKKVKSDKRLDSDPKKGVFGEKQALKTIQDYLRTLTESEKNRLVNRTKVATKKNSNGDSIERMTIVELKAELKKLGVKGYSTLNKAGLVSLLKEKREPEISSDEEKQEEVPEEIEELLEEEEEEPEVPEEEEEQPEVPEEEKEPIVLKKRKLNDGTIVYVVKDTDIVVKSSSDLTVLGYITQTGRVSKMLSPKIKTQMSFYGLKQSKNVVDEDEEEDEGNCLDENNCGDESCNVETGKCEDLRFARIGDDYVLKHDGNNYHGSKKILKKLAKDLKFVEGEYTIEHAGLPTKQEVEAEAGPLDEELEELRDFADELGINTKGLTKDELIYAIFTNDEAEKEGFVEYDDEPLYEREDKQDDLETKYSGMTVDQLKRISKKYKIKVSGLNKVELIAAIVNNELAEGVEKRGRVDRVEAAKIKRIEQEQEKINKDAQREAKRLEVREKARLLLLAEEQKRKQLEEDLSVPEVEEDGEDINELLSIINVVTGSSSKPMSKEEEKLLAQITHCIGF